MQTYSLKSHSHHQWVEQVIAEHELNKPFAPENGQPLKFKVGDEVIYTNDYGVEFIFTITGYYKPEKPCSLYATGYRYLVNSDAPWMPKKESSLRPLHTSSQAVC